MSPYARGPIGGDDSYTTSLASPNRMLRKIPRAPFKVRGGREGRVGGTAAAIKRKQGMGAQLLRSPPTRTVAALLATTTLLSLARRHSCPLLPQVLDAPSLADDYYLNLVDWSAQNVLAVGLGTCVYLWSACTSKVTRLVDFGEAGGAVCRWGAGRGAGAGGCARIEAGGRRLGGGWAALVQRGDTAQSVHPPASLPFPPPPPPRHASPPCSVSWSQRGSYLSVGSDKGEVQIWDATKCKR